MNDPSTKGKSLWTFPVTVNTQRPHHYILQGHLFLINNENSMKFNSTKQYSTVQHSLLTL